MDYIETEGDTIDQAIENALEALGVDREKITVDILSEGKKGILGFGAQKARIRASLTRSSAELQRSISEPFTAEEAAPQMEAAALVERARAVLSETLRLMGTEASVHVKAGEASGETVLEIHTDRSGLLIGRKGQTLEALQYVVGRIVGDRQDTEGAHIVIDVENYRERRRKTLQDMALRLGEKAKRQRKTITVDALSPADRRVIHAALQDDPWLTTKSLGQGSYRRLLIIPEGDRKKRNGANPGDSAPSSKPTKDAAGSRSRNSSA